MFTLNLIDLLQQAFFYRTRRFRVLMSTASINFELPTNPTKFCRVSLIALLQCLESLESGQRATQWAVLARGRCKNGVTTKRNKSGPMRHGPARRGPRPHSAPAKHGDLALAPRMYHTHRVVVQRIGGKPFFNLGDYVDDVDVGNILAGHERNTLK